MRIVEISLRDEFEKGILPCLNNLKWNWLAEHCELM